MSKDKVITGNSLLDRLMAGPYVKNPDYNPKTKKGKMQPPIITDTSAGDINGGGWSNTANKVNKLAFTGRDLGLTNEQIESDAEIGVTLSPYNTEDELNKARADNQNAFEQFGNFLVQAGVGEVVLGTLEGFGNIADGIINSFTGDNYGKNPYTQFMTEAKENLKENFKIYREDPNAYWAMGDFGWWMDNAVSVASTASLLIPAAGWAKGLSYAGKLSGLSKLGRATARGISKGIAKATTKGANVAGDFGAIRTAAAKAGRIDQSIRGGAGIITQAALSRTGENYMEAKAIYDDVYTSSKENLDNMPNEEFDKFLINNPEFADMSKDDIAKEIARKSANKTFYNDYWMLLMDIPQFKALGSIWGKGARRSSTARERIAAANQRKLLAGATNEQLIKDNILNRTKEGIRYAIADPKRSFAALELGEGFEELYQGIQSEKGMEVVAKYFDPSLTSRTLSSYLSDASMWEQGFWGTLGGVAFNKIGRGLQKGSKALQGLWNKKHMTAEDYERWKRSNDKIALEQINNVNASVKQFVSDMEQINNGTNPYDFIRDKSTGQYIIKDGNIVNETIDEEQKDLLKEHAIKRFVDNTTLDAVDNGTIDLMKEIIGSKEFDKFITDNGLRLSASDRALSEQVIDRMNEVSGIYYNALNDVNSLTEDANPYVTINAARDITRNKLRVQDYDAQLANVDARIAEANDTNTDYSAFEEKTTYDSIQNTLIKLRLQRTELLNKYNDGEISKSAYELHNKEIERSERALIELAARTTTQGAFDSIKETIKDLNYNTQEVIDQLNEFINNYNRPIEEGESAPAIPTETIENLIKQKIAISTRRAFTEAKIPTTKQDFENLYDEFAFSMDAMMLNKAKDGVEQVKEYLRNAEDFDEALNRVMNENTGNSKLDEALHFLKYGYFINDAENGRMRGQLASNIELGIAIEDARKERAKADERREEAAEQDVELPSSEETNNDSPSTGEETQTGTTGTTNAAPPVTANPADTTSQPEVTNTGTQITPDAAPITDTSIPAGENPLDTGMSERELQEQAAIASGYETDSLKASLDASKYVMQIGFKESGRLDNITKALANGDASKYEDFIKEITDFLISRGYNKNLAELTAGKAFTNTVASFAAMNTKSSFGKLAQQLAMGFGEDSAKKYSITELIDGNGLNEIVEAFLQEYSDLVRNNNTIDDVQVINMESLFNFILNNNEIDTNTAAFIYNNIGKFIAAHDGTKYRFTGFNTSTQYSAEQFFNRINENKAQVLASMNHMHISPIEPDQRTPDYTKALVAAANGAKSYVQIEGTSRKDGNVELDDNGEPLNTHLAVYVNIKKGKKTVPIKIGILRTVKVDGDLSHLSPVSHYSGFSNVVTVNSNNDISLDCDFLFNALIDESSTDASAKQLFNDLAKFYITIQDINNRLKANVITAVEAKKEMSEAMPLDVAKRILGNSLITQLLRSERYKFYKPELLDEIGMARKLARDISSILFYGHDFDSSDPTNYSVDTMALDANTMRERYDQWKQKVYSNYVHTYELQKGLTGQDSKVDINVNAAYYTTLNTVSDPNQYPNIADAGFDVDKNSPNYTPLVMVNTEGHLIDEDGNDYGLADISIGNYSTGFLVHNKDDVKYVAYFNRAQELHGGDLYKAVRSEIANLITKQLYNTVTDTHDANFDEIVNKLIELFNPKGAFIFNNFKTTLLVDKAKSFATIAVTDNAGNKTNLITFYLRDSNNVTNSNAIGLYIPRLGRQVPITSLKGTKLKTGEIISEQEVRDALNAAIESSMTSFKLNKSLDVLMNRTTGGAQSRYYRRENGKFIINLGGKDYTYENYGDFLLQNRGFNTNVDGSNGSFVTGHLNENRITIDTSVRDTTQDVSPENTFVSDLLFNDKNPKRKTVDTKDVLEAAGVPQEKIDILLGTNSGMPIASKKVKASTIDDGTTNAYYDTDDNTVYITAKGAAAMNSNPTNAVRLILHENLHRLFHNKRNYTDAQRQRIVSELREVYDYTRAQLEKDRASGKINETIYNAISRVFDKATVSDNEQTRMEEFLMECLTQPVIVNYLNNTDYHSEAIVDGIPQKSKSIFQKIMDILLDLLGINTNRIKNNSMLAREYIILSRTANATDAGLFARPATTENTSSPVEGTSAPKPATTTDNTSEKLAKVRQEIDDVRKGFESRIKRSENFAEDHTYLIDGTPAELSVTQRLHGKRDIGVWETPASLLGNTADDAARIFFENDGHIPEGHNIPNVTEEGRAELERDLNKIKTYLDKRFGKGKYGVITEEFPIGGVINVNSENKTIAGTMDMIVYTADGDIYIFDFKTKRLGTGSGEIDDITVNGYKQQVNIYRQLIVANNPNLAGRVKTGALIKFITDYPAPTGGVEYQKHPTIPNQLQVRESKDEEFVNIQDSYVDYSAPYFFGDEDFEKAHIINVEQQDFVDEINALPERPKPSEPTGDIAGSEMIQEPSDGDFNAEDYDFEDDDYTTDDFDIDDTVFKSTTDLIEVERKGTTSTEIYATPVANGATDNAYGVQVVNDINSYVDSFPSQYRADIKQLLADNELNYTCQ
jgi:hypothetical protein